MMERSKNISVSLVSKLTYKLINYRLMTIALSVSLSLAVGVSGSEGGVWGCDAGSVVAAVEGVGGEVSFLALDPSLNLKPGQCFFLASP